MHDMIPLACPILCDEVGQNMKVGVLGGHMSQCALS